MGFANTKQWSQIHKNMHLKSDNFQLNMYSFLKFTFFILPNLIRSQCNCQSNACNMNTKYRGSNYVNGTNEIGVTLPNSSDGVNQCKSICRWITDCENFSWKEGQCKLIK